MNGQKSEIIGTESSVVVKVRLTCSKSSRKFYTEASNIPPFTGIVRHFDFSHYTESRRERTDKKHSAPLSAPGIRKKRRFFNSMRPGNRNTDAHENVRLYVIPHLEHVLNC